MAEKNFKYFRAYRRRATIIVFRHSPRYRTVTRTAVQPSFSRSIP